MFNLQTFMAGFILGSLLCYAIVLFTRRDSRLYCCWPCYKARHCAQLPAHELCPDEESNV